MQVIVDQTRCETAGICVKQCPAVFAFEPGSKKARAVEGEIPKDCEAAVLQIALACPAGAIRISNE